MKPSLPVVCFVAMWLSAGSASAAAGIASATGALEQEIRPAAATKYYRSDSTLSFAGSWGKWGKSDGLVAGANDIAWAPDGTVFIAQAPELSMLSRVQQFSEGGQFIRWFGGYQNGFGQDYYLRNPKGIAVSPDSSLWITQAIGNDVSNFSAVGTWIRTWSAPGVFYSTPWRIAVAADRTVVFSDYWNGIIYGFSEKGKKLWEHMEGSGSPAKSYQPQSVAIGADGRIYLADNRTYRIVVLDKSGNKIGGWGRDGRDPGSFMNIAKVAVGPEGDVYVSDRSQNDAIYRIQRFSPDGALVNVSNLQVPPCGTRYGGSFTVADDGTVYVLDQDEAAKYCRVALYRPAPYGTTGKLGKILGRVKGLTAEQLKRVRVRLEGTVNGVRFFATVRPKTNQVFKITRFPVEVPFTLKLLGYDVSRFSCPPVQGIGAPKSLGNDLTVSRK